MNYELEYNARPVAPAVVARSFVPPERHFARLIAGNHTLILGPRGSGKTTLLKMLTLKALSNWAHERAQDYISQVQFNAAFIAADVAWGTQIDSLERLDFGVRRKEAAFVLHSLRALVHAMREAVELSRRDPPSHLRHLCVSIATHDEERIVATVSDSFGLKPAIRSLLGLELALEARLDEINTGYGDSSFSVEAFPSKISLLISAFNGISGQDDRRWALLFDELEIAPTNIKAFLLSGIRSFDQRVIVKLAMAPYMEDVGFERNPTSPQPLHDYRTVQLTYPNKEDAIHFSVALFRNAFERIGLETPALDSAFESGAPASFGRRLDASLRRGRIPEQFRLLASKDDSFARYIEERGLLTPGYQFTETNIAKDIRKVLPIVTVREYYLRRFAGSHVVLSRSRKSHALYTGFPSIVEVTEGNPRAILTLIGPMAQEYAGQPRPVSLPISAAMQTQALRRIELLLTSLLQVIPLDVGGFEQTKGMLDFVDQIGRAFEERLLKRPFSTDYVGTFVLDDKVTTPIVSAVGRALNAGAIIHVPYAESGPDSLLRGLVGQRFRLSYALAARYRLLLTLGDRISLSRLLLDMRGLNVTDSQVPLFDLEGLQ